MVVAEQHPGEQSRSSVGRASRTGVGHSFSVASRLFGNVSSIQATRRFLTRQLWAWPIVAAVLFGGTGLWVHHVVENAMREQRIIDINAKVDACASALHVWMGEQQINLQLIAADEQLAPLVLDLLALPDGTPTAERQLVHAPAQESLRARLTPRLKQCGYVGFFVVSPEGVVLAADVDFPIGKTLTDDRRDVFDRAISGKTLVSKPYLSPFLLQDEHGELRANLPTMFSAGPLFDQAGRLIAALGLRIRPEAQFTQILETVRFGESGETYAFDRNGLLLSQSRFDEEMKQIGLLADLPDIHSILTVELRDPGVDLVAGERPKLRRHDQPLTRLAAAAVQGQNGHDADGFRGYRGVWKVGAWRWLPEYDFGIATDMNIDEALRPLYILRRAFWGLMVLLALSAGAIFVAMLVMTRQQKALQQATLVARQLGQYALEEKLGSDGMGTVYKARHAMLRRPAAVKLLDVDKMSDSTIARFEREVQLTSALTHPNTISVFDYGRTPDGIFYYAMEYLEGLNLDELVKRTGALPEARVVFILRQVCGSLAEAHAAGLVHRDIKPANILITHRGGLHDFVKVLDFGLVKALENQDQAHVTNPNALMGTPLYLSPEAVNQPDSVNAQADVYAVDALGYFLLTATPVFSGATIMAICMKHAKESPEPPSVRSGKPISPTLEALILRCLAKSPADRPRDASQLLSQLEACIVTGSWSGADATAWWTMREQVTQCETVKPANLEPTQIGTIPASA